MPPISSLPNQLQRDFSKYTFAQGVTFKWSPDEQTITYAPLRSDSDAWTLLHELAHAELGHYDYTSDITLVRYEAAAWEHARADLAPAYGLAIDDDHIQDTLDTYRVWLHKRSTCPQCRHNGLQTTQNTYSCINCRCLWRVNEARVCRLTRRRLKQPS